MNWGSWRFWRRWAPMVLLALAGCQGVFGRQGLPRDPLFVSRRPVPGNVSGVTPAGVAAIEPALPPVPQEIANRPAYARRKAPALPDRVVLSGQRDADLGTGNALRPPRTTPGILTNRPIPRDAIGPPPQDR